MFEFLFEGRQIRFFIWHSPLSSPPWCLDHLDQPKFIVIVFHKQQAAVLAWPVPVSSGATAEFRALHCHCLGLTVLSLSLWTIFKRELINKKMINTKITDWVGLGILTKTELSSGERTFLPLQPPGQPSQGFLSVGLINAAGGGRRPEKNKDSVSASNYPVNLASTSPNLYS